MTTFLGIDIGSTTIKGALLDLDRGAIGHVRVRPFPLPVERLPASHFEVDPAEILAAAQEVLGELAIGVTPAGVVVCSQMGGVIVADDELQPLSNYLSWRDQRLLEPGLDSRHSYFEQLKQSSSEADLRAVGNELQPGSATSLLFWLAENKMLPRGAIAMTLGDFVVARLCQCQPRMEPSLALGILNLEANRVPSDWLQRIGCEAVRWPEVTMIRDPIGKMVISGRQVPCYPAVGDQQAALLGAGLTADELSLNISTGSQVSRLTGRIQPGDYQTRPFFDGLYLNTITHLPAGRSLNALTNLLTELARRQCLEGGDPWDEISDAVDRTPDTDLEVNLNFFAGALGNRGHIQNMRLENLTVGHLFRAAFRTMAENYLLCADRLSPGRHWTRVVLSGGLAQRLPSLRGMIAEQFDCPLRIVETAEETLAGLLEIARRISGFAPRHGDASHALV